MSRLVLTVCLAVLFFSEGGHAQTPNPQLIGSRLEEQGLMNHYTYTYAWSEPVDVMQVMPVIAANGTPTQKRRARRLIRSYALTSALMGIGMASAASGGFFGEPQLKTRQTAFFAGSGLFLFLILGASIQDGKARRLIQAYNDTLLTETDGYVRSYTGNPYLTLADTVALSGNRFSYRGLDGVLPTRTNGFDWKRAKPRFGVAGTIGLGLSVVGH